MTESTDQNGLDSLGKGTPDPWGYYYLRYFVGAIVGAGLLVGLWVGSPVLQRFPHTLPPKNQEWLNLAASITALGTAGLAYCYIASAPILLMHGFRLYILSEKVVLVATPRSVCTDSRPTRRDRLALRPDHAYQSTERATTPIPVVHSIWTRSRASDPEPSVGQTCYRAKSLQRLGTPTRTCNQRAVGR